MIYTSADIRDLGYDPDTGDPIDGPTSGGKAKEGRGRLPQHVPGRMNKTEREYADYLDLQVAAGLIACWSFEPLKLRLADRTFYEPDFQVQTPAGHLELHEVKGFWADDARVKIKVAAELHPCYLFKAVRKIAVKDGGGWEVEVFNA